MSGLSDIMWGAENVGSAADSIVGILNALEAPISKAKPVCDGVVMFVAEVHLYAANAMWTAQYAKAATAKMETNGVAEVWSATAAFAAVASINADVVARAFISKVVDYAVLEASVSAAEAASATISVIAALAATPEHKAQEIVYRVSDAILTNLKTLAALEAPPPETDIILMVRTALDAELAKVALTDAAVAAQLAAWFSATPPLSGEDAVTALTALKTALIDASSAREAAIAKEAALAKVALATARVAAWIDATMPPSPEVPAVEAPATSGAARARAGADPP
jgi:hypothetical protein